MQLIELSQGFYTTVDDLDYLNVGAFSWNYSDGYARRTVEDGTTLFLHHAILGLPSIRFEVDHIDNDKLNNRRENLRFVTSSINNQKRNQPKGKFGFIGVYFNPSRNWFYSQITKDGKTYTCKTNCATPEEAARARDIKTIELFGKNARLNFPLNDYTNK